MAEVILKSGALKFASGTNAGLAHGLNTVTAEFSASDLPATAAVGDHVVLAALPAGATVVAANCTTVAAGTGLGVFNVSVGGTDITGATSTVAAAGSGASTVIAGTNAASDLRLEMNAALPSSGTRVRVTAAFLAP